MKSVLSGRIKKDSHKLSSCLVENMTVDGMLYWCGFDECKLRYCKYCWQTLNQRCLVYFLEQRQELRSEFDHLNQ